MKKETTIAVRPIVINTAEITIAGDSDLILNKMDAPTTRAQLDKQANKSKSTDAPNEWEVIMTKIHWRDGTPTDFSEKGMAEALKTNAPCITTFGLLKSFGNAAVRTGIEKNKTGIEACVNIVAPNGLVPIQFSEYNLDEKLIMTSGPTRKPVRTLHNRFSGWSATFTIQFLDKYSLEQLVQVVTLAGFSIGIGSGRSSGYGRYHVVEVKK